VLGPEVLHQHVQLLLHTELHLLLLLLLLNFIIVVLDKEKNWLKEKVTHRYGTYSL